MKRLIIFLTLIAVCFCEIEFSARSRNFSIELLYFTQSEAEGHVVISPFGIWTLMTGVALGATGESYKQVRRAFILPRNPAALIQGYKDLTKTVLDPPTTGVTLTSKNYVFLDDDFNISPQFRTTVQNDFGASVKILNFNDPNTAARIANNYILNSGGGRVSNVLKSEDFAEARMILTNVISFKGLWTYPFNVTETARKPFYDEQRRVIGEVNMMYQRGPFRFSSIQDIKAFVLELPYGNDKKYSMLIILPHNNVQIETMYKNFANYTLVDVVKRLEDDDEEFGTTEVDVQIPRFKISTNVILNKPLNSMGVYDIFEPDLASFERVTKEKIFVSAIVHKADIEVTESGTVASASTSAIFADRISTPRFDANRPFVYFVVEKTTTTVIFGGIYSKPTVY
ncbi:serpin (serine protease inhibitor) domain-containing protein [Phthorimaea operculella]|nr:serpin (serine protease inhibitor) domain-containing protein [Phthorimaea operculella]